MPRISQIFSRSQRSQPSQLSQSPRVEEVTEETANAAVKAILTLDHSKRPMKQSDIWNSLSCKLKRKEQLLLLEQVKVKLEELGMRLVECKNTSAKSFLLVSTERESNFMAKLCTAEERADRTLLILVLAYIFMKDGRVTDDEMFRHLSSLRISEEGSHSYFGDVKKKILGQFVEQMYLTTTKVVDQKSIELSWGQRAQLEVPLLPVLEFVCQIGYGGKVQPNTWVSQYESAMKDNDNEEEDE